MLLVNSADKSSGTINNFVIRLNKKITAGGFKLLSAVIPSMYNIHQYAYRIPFNENGISKIADLTYGYYNANTLATAVASALTTASSGYNTYTCTYDVTTNKFTISAGNSFYLMFSSYSYECNYQLGFAYTYTSSATSAVSSNCVNLSGPAYYYISVDNIDTPSMNTMASPSTATFFVPNSASDNFLTIYNCNNSFDQSVVSAGGGGGSGIVFDTLRIRITVDAIINNVNTNIPMVIDNHYQIILSPK